MGCEQFAKCEQLVPVRPAREAERGDAGTLKLFQSQVFLPRVAQDGGHTDALLDRRPQQLVDQVLALWR